MKFIKMLQIFFCVQSFCVSLPASQVLICKTLRCKSFSVLRVKMNSCSSRTELSSLGCRFQRTGVLEAMGPKAESNKIFTLHMFRKFWFQNSDQKFAGQNLSLVFSWLQSLSHRPNHSKEFHCLFLKSRIKNSQAKILDSCLLAPIKPHGPIHSRELPTVFSSNLGVDNCNRKHVISSVGTKMNEAGSENRLTQKLTC